MPPTDPFAIGADEVAALDEIRFVATINRLVAAEAQWLGIPLSDVDTTLRTKDPDGGIDARVLSRGSGDWFLEGENLWQYKAGSSFAKKGIEKEIMGHPAVVQAIKNGAAYHLVIGRQLTPKTFRGWQQELQRIVDSIQPGSKCRLLDAGKLASWATEHPAMLFTFGRPIGGLVPIDRWASAQPKHQVPFQPDEARTRIIEGLQEDFSAGAVHRRIEGKSGVGKTRTGIEAFRDQQFRTLYTDNPEQIRLEFFTWMASNPNASVIVVADECDSYWNEKLEERANLCYGRVKLLTIGAGPHRDTPPELIRLEPLDQKAMESVVRAAAGTLSDEQAEWIARAARGYVKLAVALAQHVASGQAMTAASLSKLAGVETVLEALLPDTYRRRVMRGLALLSRVGWDEELKHQGEAVAKFVGLDHASIRATVAELEKEGLVSRQGRYRYVSPEILAVWLAAEVWEYRSAEIADFSAQLPDEDSKQALVNRLTDLGDVDEVAKVLDQMLGAHGAFPDLGALDERQNALFFFRLAPARSEAALTCLERLFDGVTHEDLESFESGRSYIVPALEALAWGQATFRGAAELLLRLAEAENQTFANNATGVWTSLFYTRVANTEMPALERYPVIELALEELNARGRQLGVLALERALAGSETGVSSGGAESTQVPRIRWQPKTWDELWETKRRAFELLDRALADEDTTVRGEALRVLFNSLVDSIVVGLPEEAIGRVEINFPSDAAGRTRAWEAVERAVRLPETHLKPEHRQRLRNLLHRFEESVHDQIHRFIGSWDPHIGEDGQPDSPMQGTVGQELADKIFEQTDQLLEELPWLVSSEAQNGVNLHSFARRLGELDERNDWLVPILEASRRGQNSILLASYLEGRAASLGEAWRENLLDEWAHNKGDGWLVFDATWRGPATPRAAQRLVGLVEVGAIQASRLGVLAYAAWLARLGETEMMTVLSLLAGDESANAVENGLAILQQWQQEHGPLTRPLKDLTLQFLLIPTPAGRGSGMLAYYWAAMARGLLSDDPVGIGRAILESDVFEEAGGHDERLQVFKQALELAPAEVWPLIGTKLTDPRAALRIGWWAQDIDLLGAVDPEVLLAWAKAEPDTRAPALAGLVKPGDQPTPLIRGLLRDYGAESAVGRALWRNFGSGVWWGSWSQHERGQIQVLEAWLQDREPNVRSWARHTVESIERRLPEIEREEAEEELRY